MQRWLPYRNRKYYDMVVYFVTGHSNRFLSIISIIIHLYCKTNNPGILSHPNQHHHYPHLHVGQTTHAQTCQVCHVLQVSSNSLAQYVDS